MEWSDVVDRKMTHQVDECQQRGLACVQPGQPGQHNSMHIQSHTPLPLSLSRTHTHTYTHTGAAIAEVGLLFTPFLGYWVVAMVLLRLLLCTLFRMGESPAQMLWRHCLLHTQKEFADVLVKRCQFVSCAGCLQPPKPVIRFNPGTSLKVSCVALWEI